MHSLLALCARLEGDAAYYRQLAQIAAKVDVWPEVLSQAEAHGLGPLLYKHLRTAEIQLPSTTKRSLQGLYLRHRQANQVRLEALAEILEAYQAADIQVLVLKGAALAQLIYPEPGLRPMGDIDLLVKETEIYHAQRLLADLGFNAYVPPAGQLPDKHLLPAMRYSEGFAVDVEIHHNLFNEEDAVSVVLTDLTADPIPFVVHGVNAYTLGYEETLWHLCQHLLHHTSVWELGRLRLVWLADIVGFAEKFVDEIDWDGVARHYPLVLKTLSLLHFVIPLSDRLRRRAPIKIGAAPQEVGLDFQGWPRATIGEQWEKGFGRILRDSFFPSEWWLRLRYQLGSARPVFWYRWVRHPCYISGWILHWFVTRRSRFKK